MIVGLSYVAKFMHLTKLVGAQFGRQDSLWEFNTGFGLGAGSFLAK